MGNTNLLEQTCMTPTNICKSALNDDSKYQQNIVLKRHKVRSTDQIKQSILNFIQTNKLQLYPTRERKVLETLVSVEQEHVADKIIQLDKRIKLLENQKRQLQRLNSKQLVKITNKDQKTKELSICHVNNQQKQTQITLKITKTKHKRKTLFQDSECLLIQDLDMIFEQIPKFDQNYQYISSILSLSGNLLRKAQQNSFNQLNQPDKHLNPINQRTKTNKQPINNYLKTQTNQNNQTTLSQNTHNHRNINKDNKIQEKLKKLIKFQDKKSLKKNPTINSLGNQLLKANGLLMIVPIQCFSGIGALRDNNRTGLPSGASLLQILMNKIKAVNLRRYCNLGVIFLVNQKYITKFNEQIQNTQGYEKFVSQQNLQINSNISNHESNEHHQQPIAYKVIPFKNIWPCFDGDQKIVIDSVDDQIVFSTHDGDLFSFIQNSIELKILIEKYRYVNITNINNLLSQIGDAHVLGFLQDSEEVDIAVKVLKPRSNQVSLRDYFTLDDQKFIAFKDFAVELNGQQQNRFNENDAKGQKTCSYIPNQDFLDIGQFYVKSRIFITESGPLKRLLMSRITRKINPQCENSIVNFYLQRSIPSVLYSKFTVFIKVQQEYEFSHIKSSVPHLKPNLKKNGQIGYSRYCKKLLGIKQRSQGKQEEEMVEIDAGILHKGSDEISRLINSLKKVKEVGFPIILYSDLFNNSKGDS